jgi:hypothetical protein
VADPGRLAAPAFVEAAQKAGLAVDGSDVRPVHVGAVIQRVRIYALRWCA